MYFMENIRDKTTDILERLIDLYSNHNYSTLYKVLDLESYKYTHNNTHNNKAGYIYQKGLKFCKDENPPITVRIYIDGESKNYINTLLMLTSKATNENEVIDIIIEKWLKKVGTTGRLIDNEPHIDENEIFSKLIISKDMWTKFTTACKNKGITFKIGLKMSLLNYINNIRL